MAHEDGREPDWNTDYFTKVVTDNAIMFMDEQLETDSPFYLSCHYTAPHSPWRRDQHPEETSDRYHEHCAFDTIPNVPLNPTQMQRHWLNPDGSDRRELLSGYFAAVEEMDRGVGQILRWLDEHDLRESTLVFYTSDNGMNMGHHGIFGKGNGTYPLNMYDTSVKVPCIVSWPGTIPANTVREELLSHYDVFPTLLAMAGVPCPENTPCPPRPGRSFAPLLHGDPMPEPECVVVYHEYGLVRMIRSKRWKYVHRHPWGPHELYDLNADPDEETNLAEAPEHAERITAFRAKLDAWFATYADPRKNGLHESVAGTGQINLAGPAANGKPSFVSRPVAIGDLACPPRPRL